MTYRFVSLLFFFAATVVGVGGLGLCLLQLEVGGFDGYQFITGVLAIVLACFMIACGAEAWGDARYNT